MESNSTVSVNLSMTPAILADGSSLDLTYQTSAGYVVVPSGGRAGFEAGDSVLVLSAVNSFNGAGGGERRRLSEWGGKIAVEVAEKVLIDEEEGRRLSSFIGQPCTPGNCGVDLYCDGTSTVQHVGDGYYSPAGDCGRYSCTNMGSPPTYAGGQYMYMFSPTANVAYTSSGNGTNQCVGVCRSWMVSDGSGLCARRA